MWSPPQVLLFDSNSASAEQFREILTARLQALAGARLLASTVEQSEQQLGALEQLSPDDLQRERDRILTKLSERKVRAHARPRRSGNTHVHAQPMPSRTWC